MRARSTALERTPAPPRWKGRGSPMSTIELRDVTLTYDVRPVLDHVDLVVEDGEFLVLVGPSGSGKTTALRIVAGLLRPTSGQVLVGGRDVTKVPPADRDLAMVFQ